MSAKIAISVTCAPRRMIAAQLASAKPPIKIGSSAATALRKKSRVRSPAIGSATFSADWMSPREICCASSVAATCPPIDTSTSPSILRSSGPMRKSAAICSALLPESETITSVSW